jgi:hypothetical protein
MGLEAALTLVVVSAGISDMSVRPGSSIVSPTGVLEIGGVEDRRRVGFFRERVFDVRVKIDPAQDLTFFFFFTLPCLLS